MRALKRDWQVSRFGRLIRHNNDNYKIDRERDETSKYTEKMHVERQKEKLLLCELKWTLYRPPFKYIYTLVIIIILKEIPPLFLALLCGFVTDSVFFLLYIFSLRFLCRYFMHYIEGSCVRLIYLHSQVSSFFQTPLTFLTIM